MVRENVKSTEKMTDVLEAGKDSMCLLFENDKVRVIEMMLKPGGKLSLHSHPSTLMYAFGDSVNRMTSSDGSSQDFKFKKGQVMWQESTSHEVENIGKTYTHALVIEMKK